MKKRVKQGLSAVLAGAFLMGMTACGSRMENSVDLMENIRANAVSGRITPTQEETVKMTDFAVRFAQHGAKAGENALLSPLSAQAALAMTLNGAAGETQKQMEEMFGMNTEELNQALSGYLKNLPQGDGYKLIPANAIWYRNDWFRPDEAFLQTNADLYGAELYAAPFDEATRGDVNRWVKERTEGMIPEIIREFSPNTVMCLVNALTFDAKWQEEYEESQFFETDFVQEDGTKKQTDFMRSEEADYLEDAGATGFLKDYKGGRYAFAALLPNEGTTAAEYLAGLTGEHLQEMLADPAHEPVRVSIPKFKAQSEYVLNELLQQLGMTDAFDEQKADFSGMGTVENGNVYISKVLQKTFIEVDEKGTRAAAATAVINESGCAAPQEEPKEVYLTRPFIYMIIDRETGVPVFIGTMYDPQG